jgi:hypothetical protein
MRVAFITLPPIKPSEPGLSAGAAATLLGTLGIDTRWLDASMGWHRHVLDASSLRRRLDRLVETGVPTGNLSAMTRAVASMGRFPPLLQCPETYARRDAYSSAINDLENALRLVAATHPGFRLGVAMVALTNVSAAGPPVARPSGRLESSATLAMLAETPGPFDSYFVDELIPWLEANAITHAALSLTFQQQTPAAFRLAALLHERAPAIHRLLGGPLVACWNAVDVNLNRAPFSAFHSVVSGTEEDLLVLAATGRNPPAAVEANDLVGRLLAVPLDQARWEDYLAPLPTVPVALGRGCSWRRCTFCPEHLHPAHAGCATTALTDWLRAVACRFPRGAMLHLTDSALPPSDLEHLAHVIQHERLPLRWHGFVRAEAVFAQRGFAQHLAEGGCAMLQFGVESGSPRLLKRLGKGTTPDLAREVLRSTAAARILNQVYLLFGVPSETDEDRERTLAWVDNVAAHIDGINPALLNLPKGSPMHRYAAQFGVTELVPFGQDTDLSLYDDFRCGSSHPRREARRWLSHRFFKHPAVRRIQGGLRGAFKANHMCFLHGRSTAA